SIAINGPAVDTGYSQLRVAGEVHLGIALQLAGTYTPTIEDKFIIVDNDGEDPIVGTFSTLPEAAEVNLHGMDFRITYFGGDGNDVVLVPAATTAVKVVAGHLQIIDAAGGDTDDTLTLVRLNSPDRLRITDPNNVLLAGAGATQINDHTVDVPLANITGGI